MLYNIGLISAIHQHELAIDIHMFPLSWTSFPRYIFKTNFEKELHASLENAATLWTTWIIFVSLPPHLSVLCWKAAFLGSICFIFVSVLKVERQVFQCIMYQVSIYFKNFPWYIFIFFKVFWYFNKNSLSSSVSIPLMIYTFICSVLS